MKPHLSLTNIMIIVGAVIFAAYLYFVDFWQVVETIMNLDLRIALITIAIDLVCIALYAIGWKFLLKSPGIGLKDSFTVVLVSIFGDIMIPTGSISGELMRISLATKKTKLRISEVTASVLMHRLIVGITFGVVLSVSIIMLLSTQALNLAAIYLFTIIGVGLIFLGSLGVLAAVNVCRFKRITRRLMTKAAGIICRIKPGFNLESAQCRIDNGFEEFQSAVKAISKVKVLASSALLIARWFIIALIPYFMFSSLGYQVSYWVVLAVSIFVSMVQMVPVGIPGMLGVMEVSMTTFFIGFGIPADVAASATILTRLVMFWFELSISATAASYYGLSDLVNSVKGNHKAPTHSINEGRGMVSMKRANF